MHATGSGRICGRVSTQISPDGMSVSVEMSDGVKIQASFPQRFVSIKEWVRVGTGYDISIWLVLLSTLYLLNFAHCSMTPWTLMWSYWVKWSRTVL